jgi:integrase
VPARPNLRLVEPETGPQIDVVESAEPGLEPEPAKVRFTRAPRADGPLGDALATELAAAAALAEESLADRTRSNYTSHWGQFERFCAERGAQALPADPATVCAYLAWGAALIADDQAARGANGQLQRGRLRPRSIEAHLTAINRAHDVAGHLPPGRHPDVRAVMAGIRRVFGVRAERARAALNLVLLDQLLDQLDGPTPAAVRDHVLIVWRHRHRLTAGQLAALRWEAVEFTDAGLCAEVPAATRSARRIPLEMTADPTDPLCPVAALRRLWSDSPARGAVFTRDGHVGTPGLTRQGIQRIFTQVDARLPEPLSDVTVAEIAYQLLDLPLTVLRDRAVLTTGWTAALRRSNIVGLDWADVTPDGPDLQIFLAFSKTDQERKGRHLWLPAIDEPGRHCPVATLLAWRDALVERIGTAATATSPVFGPIDRHGNLKLAADGTLHRLSGEAVNDIVRRVARRAGLDHEAFGAHSLRAGFVTEAFDKGRSIAEVQAVTGHRSVDILLAYHRRAEMRRNNPMRSVFGSIQ